MDNRFLKNWAEVPTERSAPYGTYAGEWVKPEFELAAIASYSRPSIIQTPQDRGLFGYLKCLDIRNRSF